MAEEGDDLAVAHLEDDYALSFVGKTTADLAGGCNRGVSKD